MKFKGKANLEGMTAKKEHVFFEGRIIAEFSNGGLETEDVDLIDKLKRLGYESDAVVVPAEVKEKRKK